jgi:hypothetical protein
MIQKQETVTIRRPLLCTLAILNIIVVKAGFLVHSKWYYLLLILTPLLILMAVRGPRSPDRK